MVSMNMKIYKTHLINICQIDIVFIQHFNKIMEKKRQILR